MKFICLFVCRILYLNLIMPCPKNLINNFLYSLTVFRKLSSDDSQVSRINSSHVFNIINNAMGFLYSFFYFSSLWDFDELNFFPSKINFENFSSTIILDNFSCEKQILKNLIFELALNRLCGYYYL